ncbi:DUF3696 domain-containing protein [Frankia sp. Mgl5]|uniref:DUF3696 domain-containing protein n=1 Tax=Frankia sp. Mgl5 TaxID=2933793 RepID=UPI00200D1BF3|nr:DUF3696 domain-containing protein [Frankia sp. Mgl5]MCK9928063.1 DUF3696 domain-containing protein [Frankia sp. Mgl5]
MLEQLGIENFKAFSRMTIDLRPLTVLTGLNSAGKSTIIQALLLADLAENGDGPSVPLNGPHGLALGEAADVLHSGATDEMITVTRRSGDSEARLVLRVPDDRSVHLFRQVLDGPPDGRVPLDTYLCAERLGPRDLLDVTASAEGRLRVGHQGQFAAHVLAQHERNPVAGVLLHPTTQDRDAITIGGQAGRWLSAMTRPISVEATWLPNTNAAMVRFREPGDLLSSALRPANVGFGISYALPVCVAGLTARAGHLFIVENPEAHLHPAGQSEMGRFLVRLAGAGVQTLVETHSDHVVNGIRLALAEGDILSAEDAVIHYFGAGANSVIEVLGGGRLSDWPPGFFDQGEIDLAKLARLRGGR